MGSIASKLYYNWLNLEFADNLMDHNDDVIHYDIIKSDIISHFKVNCTPTPSTHTHTLKNPNENM